MDTEKFVNSIEFEKSGLDKDRMRFLIENTKAYVKKENKEWAKTARRFEAGYCPLSLYKRILLRLGFEIKVDTDIEDDYLLWLEIGGKRRSKREKRKRRRSIYRHA